MAFGLLLWNYLGTLHCSLKIHKQMRGRIHKPYTYRNPGLTPSAVGAELWWVCSHPAQVICCAFTIKVNLTFDTANWYFLVPREKKSWNNKTSCWVCLDAGNVEDANCLHEILEINELCKRMSLVCSTISVAATQSLESWSPFCAVSSPGYCSGYAQSVAYNVSAFSDHRFPPYWCTWPPSLHWL